MVSSKLGKNGQSRVVVYDRVMVQWSMAGRQTFQQVGKGPVPLHLLRVSELREPTASRLEKKDKPREGTPHLIFTTKQSVQEHEYGYAARMWNACYG